MKCGLCARMRLLLLVLLFFGARSMAQPVLPRIAGAADEGLVLLTWVCQYDGVKTIVVKRSADSAFNYKIIGYVKKTGKGVQAFADGHPQPGNNYYKLTIVFNSGLNWSSNHCRVFVDSAQIVTKTAMPGNDSLQRFIVVEEAAPSGGEKPGKADQERDGGAITLSFAADTTNSGSGGAAGKAEPVTMRRKITLVFPEQDMEDAAFIKSRYIVVSQLNGHVVITLPNDYATHSYTIKFYNREGRMILDVPALKSTPVILDKRNFQRKGLYKFVLRKDGVELESGYVNVVM